MDPRISDVSLLRDTVGPMFADPYKTITDAQAHFIRNDGAALDRRGWAVDYRDNLFAPLHPGTAPDFAEAGELTDMSGGRIAAWKLAG